MTASAGEDSILNLQATPPIGAARMYAYLGAELTWDGWVEAVREGRTFVTNGPLIQFTINGEIPGSEIRLPAGGAARSRCARRLESIVPLETFEIIRNGKVIESIPLDYDNRKAVFEKRIEVTESGWYTLKAAGSGIKHPIDDAYPVAETSPIYVLVGDQPIRSKEDARILHPVDQRPDHALGLATSTGDRTARRSTSSGSSARPWRVFEKRRDEAR